ncbi:MAG: 2-hydroxyacyl-CoA dehydratase subunit D [Promethearchaeota archaeon]
MPFKDFIKTTEMLNNSYIDIWKKENKKVIGYYCTYIPEEIIHAGGLLGFRIRGTGAEGTSRADTILSRFNCSFIRATLDLVMQGNYNFLDGLACMNSCDHARRMYDIFKYKIVGQINGIDKDFPLFFISVPHIITDRGFQWLKEEFEIFKSNIENRFNVKITDEDLKNSIKVLNETRNLLKEIQKQRAKDKPKLNGQDFVKINIANTAVPKEIVNNELKAYLEALKEKDGISDYRARILLVGSIIDDPEFIKIIEAVGGIVVSDMLCFGLRNFWDLTEENGDPMDAITKRYYQKVSCPRMMDDHSRRFKFLQEQIKSANIDGVIGTRIEFCDLNGCECMMYEHELEDLNIPMLSLDRDYFLGDKGRFKTRCEAFIEQIE